ncbi:CPBP family intramembrane metalloprotease [Listeria booriae]|uniref:CPBP family intramembrane metalloprotease n=1 Tax=Listeria booriae TaxID=1552123 RepID=A0A7X1CCI8_9LIST|nr:type II CAAX endopeptidase family protein [Listeria booriae]MBC1492439.1 CPBP family intramembrane metalloprotease [Listeria booriae]MBC1504056.1 CPBP family intramembrane metalloprotease [Listeria booriae]MBC1524267.1 CPBP family intramembrane metalloprotease [Listeria booriae]MBC1531110.1 CPBP family intramembrane metalloprotease [Listeria booriae]MBC6135225.1 CPBP family intramembrane metalloprotease [Listeria booriae]
MNRRYWYVLLTYFAAYFSSLIGAPIVMGILRAVTDLSSTQIVTYASVYWSVFSNFIAVIIVWLLLRKQPRSTKIEQGQPASAGVSVIYAVLGFVALLIGQYIAIAIMSMFGVGGASQNTEMLGELARAVPLMIVFTSVLAPILEEIVFRKIIYGGLASRMNIHVAAVISSLFFGLMHMDLAYLLVYFVIGLMLCYMYTKTKRIAVPIAAHMLMNVIAMIIQFTMGGNA